MYVISYNICMQVVWDTSYRLGCGAKFCASVTSSSITRGHIVVCQYGPGWVDYNVQQSCAKLIFVGEVWDSPTSPAYILQCLTLMSSQNGGRKRLGYTGLVWVCWSDRMHLHTHESMKVMEVCNYVLVLVTVGGGVTRCSSSASGHIVVCQYGPGWVNHNIQQSCTKRACVGIVWRSPIPSCLHAFCDASQWCHCNNGGGKRWGYLELVWVCLGWKHLDAHESMKVIQAHNYALVLMTVGGGVTWCSCGNHPLREVRLHRDSLITTSTVYYS